MSKEAKILFVRRREKLFTLGRHLVIPGFLSYGLFLVRPTEHNFVSFVAQSRKIDKEFNKLFPPTDAKTVPELCEDTRKYQHSDSEVRVDFRDVIIGAYGKITFIAPSGERHKMHFIGSCGALWWRVY